MNVNVHYYCNWPYSERVTMERRGGEVKTNKVTARFFMQNLPHHIALTSLGVTPLRASWSVFRGMYM